jgi:hypothetical protein
VVREQFLPHPGTATPPPLPLSRGLDGSADLGALLAQLEPASRPGEYVFCTLAVARKPW